MSSEECTPSSDIRHGQDVELHSAADPGGRGQRVRISGYEEWQIDADGLIAESKGHFDAAEYERQLEHGFHG
jgi:hypothetical protein